MERRLFRGFRLVGSDCAGFDHRVEHLIASCSRRIDLRVRIVAIRAANQARKKRRLRECQVRNVLIEISTRGLTETVDREPRLLAHVDLVTVELKDLLLP